MNAENEKNFPYVANSHIRPRRLRRNESIRQMVQEHTLGRNHLIWPLFVSEVATEKTPITTLPGVFRIPMWAILDEIQSGIDVGLRNFMIFPIINPEKKNLVGSEAYNPEGFTQKCLQKIKDKFPDIVLFVDVALDPFTSHGHDGIIGNDNHVLNDKTVEALCYQSLTYAQSGADFVCPSDMMDGRIGAIRRYLDSHGCYETGILAYSAKYASAFYGPFRDAVSSGARDLDKRTYQLNSSNSREALRECLLDVDEGADIVMIKPGLPYLDILAKVKQVSPIPLAVYQVSGEYAMLKFGAMNHIFDEKKAVEETMLSFRRAGADLIVTYYARWICENIPSIFFNT